MSETARYQIVCFTPEVQAHFLSRTYTSRIDAQLAAIALAKFAPNAVYRVELKHD